MVKQDQYIQLAVDRIRARAYTYGTALILLSAILPPREYLLWFTAAPGGMLLGTGFSADLLNSQALHLLELRIGASILRILRILSAILMIVAVFSSAISSIVFTALWPREFIGGFLFGFAVLLGGMAAIKLSVTDAEPNDGTDHRL